ncbi:transcription elongation factor [Sulfolobus sp. SCGC AB-777_L09]|nr:transcription elongation factor [Sulfolobaceae archaeon]PVU70646.1 transcription elongation factor [Sulfolobus sp. SCGC AB-777_L09]
MGGRRKRRKQLLLRPKPKIPKVFECPRCGKVAVTITIKDGKAKIQCGNCGLCSEFEVPSVFDEANVYGKFIDMYFENKLEPCKEEEKSEASNEGESEEVHNGSSE